MRHLSSGARAADRVGHVSSGELGRDCWRGFFHDRGVDVARLVTYYTRFVIDLAPRRVQIVGCTRHPNEAFMRQAGRTLTATDEGALSDCRVLICAGDSKWSAPPPHAEESRVRVVQTPFHAPHCNAHAERFVRSIKEECLNRVIPIGERHFRRALHEFVEHYHRRTPSSGTRQ
jgi:putative transposase